MTVDYRIYITNECSNEHGYRWTIKQAELELWAEVPRTFVNLFTKDYNGNLFSDSPDESEITHDAYGRHLKAIELSEFLEYLESDYFSSHVRDKAKLMMLRSVAVAYDTIKCTKDQETYLVLYAH